MTQVLMDASMKLGQAMYEAQSAQAEADAASDAAKDSQQDDVVDADFEEIDEDDEDKKKSA